MVRVLLLVLAASHLLAQATQPPVYDVPSWVRVQANILYDDYPQTALDILEPGKAALDKRPGVIIIHGGGWVGGDKEFMVGDQGLRYLEEGFVVCNVEYRLAAVATAPAAVNDVLKAARWFREHADRYRVDKDRIIVTGTSAGGHLSLMVGLSNSSKLGPKADIAAVINWFGITDVADVLAGENRRDWAVQWLPEQEGRLELARLVSPMTYVRKDVPAVLTIHGDADPLVPYAQGVELTRALRNAGADAELISVPGGGHGGFDEAASERIWKDIFKFLKKRRIID